MEALMPLVHRGGEMLGQWPGGLMVAVCLVGALVLALRRFNTREREKRLNLQAQNRREHSFREAERAVLKYKQSNPTLDSTFILSLSLSELTEQLQGGALSPEDVFYAYMEKTLELQGKLNCCTGIILDSFEQIKTISSGKKGILYGVPISLKENLLLKDQVSSRGVVKYLTQAAADDCVLAKVLKKQGAIPFVRTNIPQGLFCYECSNPIFGQTVNPHNVLKTCGGSSGGEAALIGGGASVMGVGTDIGGSLRTPASFSGICCLKPTAGRLSSKGCATLYRGQKTVLSTPGPMGKDVESLAVFMRAVLCEDMFSLDATVPPLPFNEEVYRSEKPLRIGFYDRLEGLTATPSMMRAVQEVKALLEKAGHTLVPYKFQPNYGLATKVILADACATFIKQLKGSTIDPCIKVQVSAYGLHIWLKKLLAIVLKPLWPQSASQWRNLSGVRSVAELWKLQASIEDSVNDTIAEWKRLNIDVVLCPVLGPAFNLLYASKLLNVLPFSSTYNLLNFCAGVVPVSTVTAQDESDLAHFDNGSHPERILKEAVSGAVGLPVAVQCVALPWQEELCLRFMREVERLVKKSATN